MKQIDKSLRKLIHAAFRLLDDSCTEPDGLLTIDCHIGQLDLNAMYEALDELGIEDHESIDNLIAAARNIRIGLKTIASWPVPAGDLRAMEIVRYANNVIAFNEAAQ